MFSLEMLDVVIGLIFVYLLLSLICTAVNEFIEGFLKLRAVDLEQGIRELLNDPDATDLVPKIFDHQLIYSLFRGTYDPKMIRNVGKTNVVSKKKRYSRGSDLPSYIPARNFALAIMDVLLPATQGSAVSNTATTTTINLSGSSAALSPYNDNLPVPANTAPPANPNPLADLRNAVTTIANGRVKDAMLTILDASGDNAVKAREGIENWYNSSMDRVAGWYKRRVQQIVFIMGFVVAIVLNADSLAIFKNLANDRPLRAAIVAQAESYKDTADLNSSTDINAANDKIQKNVNSLLQMGLPIGWDDSHLNVIPGSTAGWILKFFGWIVTGLAISLGAPFWFDMLNKVMVIRSTVKPHEKSPEESSEDRQKKS